METLAAFIAIATTSMGFFLLRARREERRAVEIKTQRQSEGLTEPASLHPVIDPGLCAGCGTCVAACPEGKGVLGIVNGRAELIDPSHCIGHGACRSACPTDAITLVFGTATRGVDIPEVSPDFETNVPGLFIAGELGGMGLIRNAIEQGRQAVDSVSRLERLGRPDREDLLIVGAGPAGLSASLAAKEKGLRFVTIEQEALGGTVAHYPRGKIVMTAPARLPIVGRMSLRETTKEKLLEFFQGAERKAGLEVRYGERLEAIEPLVDEFLVRTNRDTYRTRAILLAIGRRGTPRKLGVPGEEQTKVVYRLSDPEQYRGQDVLVVGGGDSALEAATSLAALGDARVTLSYRSAAFSRAKPKNRERVDAAVAAGRLRLLLPSTLLEVTDAAARIEHEGREMTIPNDAVIVCAGGVLPTKMLTEIGVHVETKFGTL